jgi:hypothetical protein
MQVYPKGLEWLAWTLDSMQPASKKQGTAAAIKPLLLGY